MDSAALTLILFLIALVFFTIALIAWLKRDYFKARTDEKIARKNNFTNYFSCIILIANETKSQYVLNGILGISEPQLIFVGHNPKPITIAGADACKFEELADFDEKTFSEYLSRFGYKGGEKIKFILEGIEARKKLPKSITKRKTLIINISGGNPVICFVKNQPENVKRIGEIREILRG
ncbi:MAG: hypothetical protein FWH20_08380 [Oscillospiraceae bacterium]|nr:hypothetical protein [Oscillospiraceae bacterium]